MATPLNVFTSTAAELTTVQSIVYTVPTGNTGIVLMAQVTNVTGTAADATVIFHNGADSSDTELVKDFTIAPNDAAGVITGKLVLKEGDWLEAVASTNSALKITLSILESLNA